MLGDFQTHPFYKPLWRRVAVVAAVALWLAVELFYFGSPFWGVIAAALLGYSGWKLLFTYPKTPT